MEIINEDFFNIFKKKAVRIFIDDWEDNTTLHIFKDPKRAILNILSEKYKNRPIKFNEFKKLINNNNCTVEWYDLDKLKLVEPYGWEEYEYNEKALLSYTNGINLPEVLHQVGLSKEAREEDVLDIYFDYRAKIDFYEIFVKQKLEKIIQARLNKLKDLNNSRLYKGNIDFNEFITDSKDNLYYRDYWLYLVEVDPQRYKEITGIEDNVKAFYNFKKDFDKLIKDIIKPVNNDENSFKLCMNMFYADGEPCQDLDCMKINEEKAKKDFDKMRCILSLNYINPWK